MTCEEYVVDRIMGLENRLEAEEAANQKLEKKICELQNNLDILKSLIEAEITSGDMKKYSLSIYQTYDAENFDKIKKIIGFNPRL